MTREPICEAKDGEICASIEIAAPPEAVFDALTDPEQLSQWWGSRQTYRPTTRNSDLRVGGAWRAEGVGPNGEPFFVAGRYLDIARPHTLVYTWNVSWTVLPETIVSWRLTKTASGTRVELRHTGFGANETALKSHTEERFGGWIAVLKWLAAFMTRE